MHLLRFNSEAKGSATKIPDFIKVVKNVKKDKSYNLREIARKHWFLLTQEKIKNKKNDHLNILHNYKKNEVFVKIW